MHLSYPCNGKKMLRSLRIAFCFLLHECDDTTKNPMLYFVNAAEA